jgi:dipeptidase E
MRLLLGSGGMTTAERIEAWRKELTSFLPETDRVLFVPYAIADHDRLLTLVQERGINAGKTFVGIHGLPDPREAVRGAKALFVSGGNTFRLLATLERHGLLDVIRERVRSGMPYMGVSAGTNVACPTIATTNDMPIMWPASSEALGLVPFQINPHFVPGTAHYRIDGELIPYGGETREDRLREFHEENERPVLALREGAMLRIEGTRAELRGPKGALLFRRGEDPRPFEPGADLSFLLG